MRLTSHRKEIIDLLTASADALSAAAIHSALPHINLVTIYRNLDQFVNAKLVKKLFLGNQEAVYEIAAEPHHHAICSHCHKVIHFDITNDDLKKSFVIPNFTTTAVEVTVLGTCRKHLKQQPRTETK